MPRLLASSSKRISAISSFKPSNEHRRLRSRATIVDSNTRSWSGRQRFRLFRLAIYILTLLLLRYFYLKMGDPLDYIRDPAKPTRFFYSLALNDQTVIIARAWRLPRLFRITEEESFTKYHTRTRPISALRNGPRPKYFGCPKGNEDSLLAYIGIFTMWEQLERRQLLRKYQVQPTAAQKVEMQFIVGRPKSARNMTLLQQEMKQHNDIIMLDIEENMNLGKTYAFYRYLVTRNGRKPQFAFKADDDTLVAIDNLVAFLRTLDCSDLYYMGHCSEFSCGLSRAWPFFFTGMIYGLSAPLYQWLGHANLKGHHIRGPEDVRTSQLFLSLDPKRPEEELIKLHLDGRLKDLKYLGGNPLDFDPKTVLAIHAWQNETVLSGIAGKLGRQH